MCLSRVASIEDICVTQPYAPTLFSMGDLPGPVLLLQFQRGDIEQEELEREWKKLRPSAKRNRDKWPGDMRLYCRGCSEHWGEDVEQKLSEFPRSGRSQIWETVIALGMERLCTDCSGAEQHPEATAGKGNKEEADSEPSTATCRYCKTMRARKDFPDGPTQVCAACVRSKLRCAKCSKTTKRDVMRSVADYDIDHLLQCKRNRNMRAHLSCKKCTPVRPEHTRYAWQQDKKGNHGLFSAFLKKQVLQKKTHQESIKG